MFVKIWAYIGLPESSGSPAPGTIGPFPETLRAAIIASIAPDPQKD
jgi:hypothetical protein